MKILKTKKIDTLFAVVWLKTRDYKVEIINKKNYFQIENEEPIEKDYAELRESNLVMENYFDREIVLCKMSHHDSSFVTTVTSVNRRPIFVGFREQRNKMSYYIISLSDVRCSPIKISIENLFGIYGIQHSSDPLEVYQSHKVNLIFRQINVSFHSL